METNREGHKEHEDRRIAESCGISFLGYVMSDLDTRLLVEVGYLGN
ncbi:hypothetical protein [Calothrix sp. NIES-2098]